MKVRSIKTADSYVLGALLLWWLVNLWQAAFTELAHDEAYYYMFAARPDWGYFDHPPMTAWLIAAGRFLGGEIGVRFFFTLAQPLYLWILWRIIRPAEADCHDACLFVVLSAALPILELYGFLAVPDVPLLLTAALFLLCFKRFAEHDTWLDTLLLGISMALMAYSKYHGALVVLFSVAVNPRLLLRPRLYLGGIITLLLILPHLFWQDANGWVSFSYHLHDRNGVFRFSNITEHLLNTVAVFNPLLFPLYFMAWKHVKPQNAVERALYWLPILFFLFFTVSTFKGRVQPQWLIVAAFGLIFVLFRYLSQQDRTARVRKYAMTVGWITIALALLMRIEMVWNPLHIRFEIFDNRPSFESVATVADGRPVVFGGSYAIASKYIFYTGGEAYCQPDFFYRTSQWQFRDDDTRFIGKDILSGSLEKAGGEPLKENEVLLANGRKFVYTPVDDFQPVRLVEMTYAGGDTLLHRGDTLRCTLTFVNPYPYDITVGGEDAELLFLLSAKKLRFALPVDLSLLLPAASSAVATVTVPVPDDIPCKTYDSGFALHRRPLAFWYNSSRRKVEIK